jgi:A/G-specific adenine glycosylase
VEPPTSAWEPDYEPSRAVLDAPIEARWQRLPGTVRHVFTHFPLELTVLFAKVAKGTPAPEDMRWTPRLQLHEEALPGAMKKVLAHALGDLQGTKVKASAKSKS